MRVVILKPSKKTPAEVVLDIGSALGFVCRLALDYDLKHETLKIGRASCRERV